MLIFPCFSVKFHSIPHVVFIDCLSIMLYFAYVSKNSGFFPSRFSKSGVMLPTLAVARLILLILAQAFWFVKLVASIFGC